ncbi:ClpXP protease specificity-enhancing factor [Aestuariirhabdus litorea]|uniref:ClpXP protease specificity-enhancing factor n=2 Tax=Aestuariirhabdus litorea TaxID=2528527 RepID=A0A3P3VRW2_9GAMM|nr:ClpXP protease specificity-enhancing factor [Aestuariirhabdus litorea]RRJ85521.1 ClpXP protease specificity-enhancing factor [Aestuariirhabdus litorea]RWW98739.1 ClpXP protease specificity-enhancing factor [Endozoicomonadaceae bacterium GTF-13]
MSPSRPYMLRALYEWIVDNECTPYLLVNAQPEGVLVPQEFVNDGQIVLNVSPTAVRELLMTNEEVEFNGRFGGRPMHIYIPVSAVMAIYARENGQGMVFEVEDDPEPDPRESGNKGPDKQPGKPSGRPSLKVVK